MQYGLLSKALRFAAEKHEGDYRDGENALPYATHPFEVCILLRYVGNVTDEDQLCAAALHDVLEETSVTPSELEAEFGAGVTELVQELTRFEPNSDQTAGMSKGEIWLLRANMLLAEIKLMSPRAQVVKLADRLANLREAKLTKTGEKLRRYERQSKRILEIIPKSINPDLWKAIASELA
jgi:(p)ppGpp synthase/HD superfamily hydrolase